MPYIKDFFRLHGINYSRSQNEPPILDSNRYLQVSSPRNRTGGSVDAPMVAGVLSSGNISIQNDTFGVAPYFVNNGKWSYVTLGGNGSSANTNFGAAIKSDGTLWMWGINSAGQLGDNSVTQRNSPVQTVCGGTNWKQVSCGVDHTAAIKTDGTLWSCGYGYYGQLGDNTQVNKSSPVQTVAGGTNWKHVACGRAVTAATKTDGTLWLWGNNNQGQLGNNTVANKSSPVQTVAGGTNWRYATCSVGFYNPGYGTQAVAAIKTDGTLWLWGSNIVGELGDNTTVGKSSPVQTVAGGTWTHVDWVDITTGPGNNECGGPIAVKTDGTLWGWGAFAAGGNKSSPVQINSNSDWIVADGFDVNNPYQTGLGISTLRISTLATGEAWLYGSNNYGQLGDGTVANKSSPVQTLSGGTNWKQVACGYKHTATIKTDGTLWLWGRNDQGQLGDNTVAHKSSPVQTVAGGTNWKQVSCGTTFHTAAIKTDGTLWAWGQNTGGQLGDNTVANKSSPVQTVAGGTNWKQVSCGQVHTASIKTDGTLWLWGQDVYGQLGDNTTVNKSSPVQTVAGGTSWKQVSCINSTSAIKTDGTLWGWGQNTGGQIGDGTVANKSSPVQTIAGGTDWKQVAGGLSHTMAIKTDGTLWTWGQNAFGQLGNNTTANKSSPVQTVTGGTNWKQVIACGYYNTAAVKTDGTLWMWGLNNLGQLGDNTAVNKSSPVQTIAGGNGWAFSVLDTDPIDYSSARPLRNARAGTVTDQARYLTKSYLIDAYPNLIDQSKSAGLWCWGDNGSGRLGDGTTVNKSSPVQTIAGGTNWKSIATSKAGSFAGIKTDGTLWTCGYNNVGELGDGTIVRKSSPVQTVAGGTNWKTLAGGDSTYHAIKTDGTLWTWGVNTSGQLGLGDTANRSSPTQVGVGSTNWASLAGDTGNARSDASCGAIKTDGTLWTWGYNAFGALGNNTITSTSSPIQTVCGGTNWKSLSGASSSFAAIKTDGTLWTWGKNTYGQLGDNTVAHKSSPIQTVAGGTDWKQASGGGNSTDSFIVAIKTDGTLWTWGSNTSGQLGDNTVAHKSSPVQTVAGGTNWKLAEAGSTNVISIKTDGTLWTWGKNSSGELGDTTVSSKSSPIQTIAGGTNWKSLSRGRGSNVFAIKDFNEDL